MKNPFGAAALGVALCFGAAAAFGVPPGSTPLPAWIANVFSNPYLYGAPSNTKLIAGSVTATASSTSITVSGAGFAFGDVGKYIVISGLGLSITQSAAVASGGSGNAVGDVLTLSMSGCATATQLTVTAAASGAVQAAVPTVNGFCAPASLPANPVNVASTTGSGTGATFNLTSAAASLATTISGVVSPTQITLATPSKQTLSAVNETIAWGSDDSSAINNAMASGSNSLMLPANGVYGISNPINLPTGNRIKFDCNGATIVALAPVAEMLNEAVPSSFYATSGSSVQNCNLKGMGQAMLNVSHEAFKWTYRDNFFEDAAPGGGNLYVGTQTGYGENSLFTGNQYRNNSSITGAWPQYIISNNYSDNHFVDEIGEQGVFGVLENSAGTYYTGVHIYETLASNFVTSATSGNLFMIDDYADGVPSYVAGFQINGSYTRLIGWHATNPYNAATNPIGVYLSTQNGYNTIALGDFQNISPANAITKSWANFSSTTNNVVFNLNATYQGVFGDSSVVMGYSAAYGNGSSIELGSYSGATYGSVAIGTSAYAGAQGSISLGYQAGDNGSAWSSYSPSGGLSSSTGVAQHQLAVLEQTTSGSSAVRLTSTAGSAAKANCAWLPYGATMAFDVRLAVNDKTAAGKHYGAFWTAHLYSKDGTASTTLIDGSSSTLSPDSTRIVGTWTGASANLSADTTNGCLNLSFTPPTGNADTLDIVAEIYGPQGQ